LLRWARQSWALEQLAVIEREQASSLSVASATTLYVAGIAELPGGRADG
jgi:hypothetical protein